MRGFSFPSTQLALTIVVALALDAQSPREKPAAPAGGDTKVNLQDGLKYAWIPPGSFMMGCSPDEAGCTLSGRAHRATLMKGFWIGQTEVTQAAYERHVGKNPSQFKGPALPVESITWVEAQAYCKAAGGQLPTEAEWEYAARAGGADAEHQDLNRVAWHAGNSEFRTHDVGQKEPNAWKLYDMLGNVWEWVADLLVDPQSRRGEERRIHRGGAWGMDPRYVSVSIRPSAPPDVRSELLGVRCVLD